MMIDSSQDRLLLNLAIVGAGRTGRAFLEFLDTDPFSYLRIIVVGVCDINPKAEGMTLAEEKGIYTTAQIKNLFAIQNLDIVIELANSREALLEIIRLKPQGVGVFEHNLGKLLTGLYKVDQRLISAELQTAHGKGAAVFLIQQANERIMVLNTDFSIVEANEAFLKAVGKTKKEVIGAHCYEVTHGLNVPCSSFNPELGCPLIETLRTGESAHVIHEHPSSEGHPTYFDIVTYPLRGQEGEVLQVIEIWRDITEELSSRWENRVQEMKNDFQKLIQEDRMISLGKLVASSVHEINNPIQGLLTFSHLMQETLEEDELNQQDIAKFRKYLSLMSSELERCGGIVSGLLSFTRQYEMAFRDVDLNDILEQVITLTRHRIEIQEIRLNIKMAPNPLIVNGDINQLQQCFLNLIFNAVEAMPQGGQLDIVSEQDRDAESATLKFRDTGLGIGQENIDHIFDPFFTTKEESVGTGLGLSIVYGIVKNHGGDIRVESRLGKGSTFVLQLPTH
ncbi:ATP-binding protein [Thermodesulfobacteriota bacterium]